MKKLGIVAATMVLCASVYASSLSVPWYVDNAAAGAGVPGKTAGTTALVVLKSNRSDVLECKLDYYNALGQELGPFGADATFSINPFSSLSFRPVADDSGLESTEARKVPNRPRSVNTTTPIPGTANVIDTKSNGAITVSWDGGASDVQGIVTYFQTDVDPRTGATVTMSYGTLLPPGF